MSKRPYHRSAILENTEKSSIQITKSLNIKGWDIEIRRKQYRCIYDRNLNINKTIIDKSTVMYDVTCKLS